MAPCVPQATPEKAFIAELWHGVERATGAHKLRRQRYLNAVLGSLPIIPHTEQTAYKHARIWAELVVSGRMIGYYDLIVGATALDRGSGVATFNKRRLRLRRFLVQDQEVGGLNPLAPTNFRVNALPVEFSLSHPLAGLLFTYGDKLTREQA